MKNICNISNNLKFNAGFSTFATFMVCFNFLRSSHNKHNYWSSGTEEKGNKDIRSPLNEIFLTFVHLRVGLLEQDLAYCFGISQSTVYHILITWINFMYLQLKQIPLWPEDLLVLTCQIFSEINIQRVIIDTTEITVEQPALPELQQLTFSNYKNRNTYKGLIAISPSGAVTFVSDLYSGSISDKELTQQSALLELLDLS